MVLGDALCLSAAVLYGAGNVGEEYLVKQNSRIEYLGMIGLFGSIISGIQLYNSFYRRLTTALSHERSPVSGRFSNMTIYRVFHGRVA